jgi:elongation factor P
MKVNAGNLKRGEFIIYNGEIHAVTKVEFYSPGKGSAVMRTSLKNVKSGKSLNYTYKSQEDVETVDVDVVELQYLYKDNEFLYFMNESSYEQFQLPIGLAENLGDYIKEGDKLFVLMHDGTPISVRPPQSVRLAVVEADEAAKGDTVTNTLKPVKVETGVIVMAPLFIKVGDVIIVDPETGTYTSRVGVKY